MGKIRACGAADVTVSKMREVRGNARSLPTCSVIAEPIVAHGGQWYILYTMSVCVKKTSDPFVLCASDMTCSFNIFLHFYNYLLLGLVMFYVNIFEH